MDLILFGKFFILPGLLYGISRYETCISAHPDLGLFTEVSKADSSYGQEHLIFSLQPSHLNFPQHQEFLPSV